MWREPLQAWRPRLADGWSGPAAGLIPAGVALAIGGTLFPEWWGALTGALCSGVAYCAGRTSATANRSRIAEQRPASENADGRLRIHAACAGLQEAMALLERSGSQVVMGLSELSEQLQAQITSLIERVTLHHEASAAFADAVLASLEQAQSAAVLGGHTVAQADRMLASVQEHQRDVERAYARLQHVAQDLHAHTVGIRETGRTVTGIAGQTALLALNARIEATRSSSGGRGFAVVAEAFGDLASQSKSAAKRISDLNGLVEQGIDHTVATVAETAQIFDAQKQATIAVCRALDDVRQSHGGMASVTQQVADEVMRFAGSQRDFTAALEAITERAVQGQAAMQGMLFDLFEHLQTADICRQRLAQIEASLQSALRPTVADPH